MASGHGGPRPGAGRPKGTTGRPHVLPEGAVKALKAHRRFTRMAADATRGQQEAVTEAEKALLDVLRDDWRKPGATAKIASAAQVLDRAAGAVTKPLTVAGPDGGPLRVSFALDTSAADAQSVAAPVITAGSEPNVLGPCKTDEESEGER